MSSQRLPYESDNYSYLTGKPIADKADKLTLYQQHDLELRQAFLVDFHKIARLADLIFWILVTWLTFVVLTALMAVILRVSLIAILITIFSTLFGQVK